jgi:hypothetical protein
MKQKRANEKKGYYGGWLPIYVVPETMSIRGRNWFTDIILDMVIWFEVVVIGVANFPITIEDNEEDIWW